MISTPEQDIGMPNILTRKSSPPSPLELTAQIGFLYKSNSNSIGSIAKPFTWEPHTFPWFYFYTAVDISSTVEY